MTTGSENGTRPVVDLAERHSRDLDVGKTQRAPLWVLVTHRPTGRTARIKASRSNALDVFNHPFSYAGTGR